MITNGIKAVAFLFFLFMIVACKSDVKEQSDNLYSRHLQKHVELTIINTQMPEEKSDMNLLLFNNGNILKTIHAKKIIDSLFEKQLIQPVLLVGIHGNEKEDYGVSELSGTLTGPGSKADKYSQFVMNELYPFIKKKTKIRKFRSIATFGNSLAGISAFDIAWHNADKIDKAGIFAGDFSYANSTASNNESMNPVFENIRSSRKRPALKYWFYAGSDNDSISLKSSSSFIDIVLKKNTSTSADIEFMMDAKGNNDLEDCRHHFAEFLLWAFAK